MPYTTFDRNSLVSNDMHCSADRLYEVYQKRW